MNEASTHEYRNQRHSDVPPTQASWFEQSPTTSVGFFERCGVDPTHSVIDVGGGASPFVDELLARGHVDVTVLDLSGEALALGRRRNVGHPRSAQLEIGDICEWRPDRQWDVWHDRAAFLFLTDQDERDAYLRAVADGLSINGLLLVGAFAADGPGHCSGLPVQGYDAESLFAEFSAVLPLDLVSTERLHHLAPSGTTQPFTWIIARRRAKPVCC